MSCNCGKRKIVDIYKMIQKQKEVKEKLAMKEKADKEIVEAEKIEVAAVEPEVKKPRRSKKKAEIEEVFVEKTEEAPVETFEDNVEPEVAPDEESIVEPIVESGDEIAE